MHPQNSKQEHVLYSTEGQLQVLEGIKYQLHSPVVVIKVYIHLCVSFIT